jgi:hypothetical protein
MDSGTAGRQSWLVRWRINIDASALHGDAPAIENGMPVLPENPGLGLKFDEKALAAFKVGQERTGSHRLSLTVRAETMLRR